MLASIVEKFAFVIPTFYLYSQGRVAGPVVGGAALDLMWGVLFVVSYFLIDGRSE
jgi:ABC-type Co2+ transport system permease subunit